MDFQAVVDSMAAMTCVVSVEKRPGGGYGDIRIVTGNRAYIDSIERPVGEVQMLTTRFTPNRLYTDYLPRDLNFEQYCFQAAVGKRCLHSYAHPDRFDVWFNMTFLPLTPDEGDLCFCTYTMEINLKPDSSRLSNISSQTGLAVLETAIKLRGATDFEATMKDVVKDIREICQARQCCILLMEPVSRTCTVLCEDIAGDVSKKPMKEILDDSFYDLAESWENVISGSNCLIAKDDQDMEVVRQRNPRWYRSLVENDVHSIVLFPLRSRNERHGYIWATDFNAEDAPRIKEALELSTFILGSEIGNHLLLKRLQILSARDMLTGALNRNEMNNHVDALSSGRGGKSVGVLFADLNGLKRVNDAHGHHAGDELIRAANRVLRQVFHDEEIFRAGGDEFTVIVVGANPDEMAERARAVRALSEHEDRVSFALGYHVESDCRNVREALRRADENMYEDKHAYYARHPEMRRN